MYNDAFHPATFYTCLEYRPFAFEFSFLFSIQIPLKCSLKCYVYYFRWERAAAIEQALATGRCVVADRYSYSGIVYTASKVHTHTPSWDWCLRSEEELPQPDLVLCLLPDHIDDLESRGGFGEERFENALFQARVLNNYRRLAEELKSRRANGNKETPLWRWINVKDASISEVHQMVLKEVEETANT